MIIVTSRSTITIFSNLSLCGVKQNRRGHVNPYDDRKVSLRRPHGNDDVDIVGASYTRRKANVTEALSLDEFEFHQYPFTYYRVSSP